MGKSALDLLFPSVRRDVLAAMLLHPQKQWYLSELGRHIGAAPSHLYRELTALAEAGILNRTEEGRQTYYEAHPECPILPELAGLLRKLMGAPVALEKVLSPLRAKIRCAFIYGSVARGEEVSVSDIDLMVVGEATIADLVPGLKKAERALGRPVNPTVYPVKELVQKCKVGHHFIRTVVEDPEKIFLVSSANDLAAVTQHKTNSAAPDKQGRNRRPARRSQRKN
jgi:predicted nucleotidyltransferase